MILVKSNLCFAPLAILLLTIFDFSLEKSIIDIEKQIDSAIINGYDTNYKCTLNQKKMVRQSKKCSKSVGSLFNQFNAFWALSCILINIFAQTLICDYYKWFYKGGVLGHFISKNEFKLA